MPPNPRLDIDVRGRPIAQGSKRHIGGGRMIESSRHLPAWRDSVIAASVAAMAQTPGWPPPARGLTYTLDADFLFARPLGHYRTGRRAGEVRPSAPEHHTIKPDLDKLTRAVFDALTAAGVWPDDAAVWQVFATKLWHPQNGARLTVFAE